MKWVWGWPQRLNNWEERRTLRLQQITALYCRAFSLFQFYFKSYSMSILSLSYYFPLILIPSIYCLKLLLSLPSTLSLFGNSCYRTFLLGAFSFNCLPFSASLPLFIWLSFFSQVSCPLLVVVFIFCQAVFVPNRIAGSLDTHWHVKDACEHTLLSHRHTLTLPRELLLISLIYVLSWVYCTCSFPVDKQKDVHSSLVRCLNAVRLICCFSCFSISIFFLFLLLHLY